MQHTHVYKSHQYLTLPLTNMYSYLFLLIALAVSALSEPPVPQGQYGAPGNGNHGGYSSGGPGGFSPGGGLGSGRFGNNDISQFTHEQDFQRTPGAIWGQYTVALPDGRTQKVEYDADESGFHPVVTFEDPRDRQGSGRGGGGGGYNY